MNNFFNWIKSNKFASALILVLILFIVGKQTPSNRLFLGMNKSADVNTMMYGSDGIGAGSAGSFEMSAPAQASDMMVKQGARYMPINPSYSPTPTITDRKVIKEANMALQVDSVSKTTDALKSKVQELNGYVVNIFINRPEFGESATVTVRVPSDSLDQFLAFARENSIKVVNENISGSDITDQYVDTETRLTQLTQQRTQMENILKSAVTVEDIMRVQPYLTSIQDQIDRLKGQLQFADGSTKVSLVTISLATDELSLPYTAEKSWRPQAIFKNASRSLLLTIQKMGTGLIWLGVYSVLIVPAITIVAIIYLVAKRNHQN